MNAVTLRRVEPATNALRFYFLDVQPNLFGGWSLVKEWGRIGHPGSVRVVPFPTQDAAIAALRQQSHAKEKRGYA